ncbi:unnamed protein product, partial [Brassica oleracea]
LSPIFSSHTIPLEFSLSFHFFFSNEFIFIFLNHKQNLIHHYLRLLSFVIAVVSYSFSKTAAENEIILIERVVKPHHTGTTHHRHFTTVNFFFARYTPSNSV